MKLFQAILLACLTIAFAAASVVAQDASAGKLPTFGKKAQFLGTLPLSDGQKGDLEIKFRVDATGQITNPQLEVMMQGSAAKIPASCRIVCVKDKKGNTICFPSGCGGGTPIVSGPMYTVPDRDFAVKFEPVPSLDGEPNFTARLFSDPASANRLTMNLEQLKSGGASE